MQHHTTHGHNTSYNAPTITSSPLCNKIHNGVWWEVKMGCGFFTRANKRNLSNIYNICLKKIYLKRSIHEAQNGQTELRPHCRRRRRQVPRTCHQWPQWSAGLRCCDEAVKSRKRLDWEEWLILCNSQSVHLQTGWNLKTKIIGLKTTIDRLFVLDSNMSGVKNSHDDSASLVPLSLFLIQHWWAQLNLLLFLCAFLGLLPLGCFVIKLVVELGSVAGQQRGNKEHGCGDVTRPRCGFLGFLSWTAETLSQMIK